MTPLGPPTVRWRRDRPVPDLPSAPALRELLREGYQPQIHTWVLHMPHEAVVTSLRRLAAVGCLEWTVGDLIARPLTQRPPYLESRGTASPRELSRFAFLQPDGEEWILQSARSPWCVQMPASAVTRLATRALSEEEWDLLDRCGLTVSPDDLERSTTWTFHDRLFADRSRTDFRVTPTAMQRGDQRSPAPVVDRFPGSPSVNLPIPALPRVGEPTLWAAMETRRTPHPLPALPLSLDQLSELLFRTLRVVHAQQPPGDEVRGYLQRWRPVPSGGAIHGIDTWIRVTAVDGLRPGWYWYRPADHSLSEVPRTSSSDASPHEAPVTLWFTVDHARTSWKYGDISLALELKDVGVIMYALQLAAEALGLAVLPQGSGSTQAIADTLGIDPEVDCPVGEMLVSARPEASST